MAESMFNRFRGGGKKEGFVSRLKTSFEGLGREGQARMCYLAAALGVVVFIIALTRLLKVFMG